MKRIVLRIVKGALLIGLVGAVGCDKLTGRSASPPDTTTPAEPTPVLPSRPSVASSDVVAKVNGVPISVRDLNLAIQELKTNVEASGQAWKRLPIEPLENQYDLHDLLDEVIMAELRAQDAVARGLDRQTETQMRFWQLYRAFFSREWMRWQLDQAGREVTEADVEKAYQDNLVLFRDPQKVRVGELVLSSEEQAKAALVKLLEGVEFETVAQQMSLRPELARTPATEQWVMRGAEKATYAPSDTSVRTLDTVLEQAVFAIDAPNGTSSYVKGADGNFHIFQLLARQPGRQKSLVEVADQIRAFLPVQKISEKNDTLQRKARVEPFSEHLAEVEQ